MKILAAGLLAALNMSVSHVLPPTLGQVMADKVVPFNKGPRPTGCATEEQRSARGPKKGKGTRRSRRKVT